MVDAIVRGMGMPPLPNRSSTSYRDSTGVPEETVERWRSAASGAPI